MCDRGNRYNIKEKLVPSGEPFNFKEYELIEALAELEHEQWSHWITYQDKMMKKEGGLALIWWRTLATAPYWKLTEKQKESDREWARKVLQVLKRHGISVSPKVAQEKYK